MTTSAEARPARGGKQSRNRKRLGPVVTVGPSLSDEHPLRSGLRRIMSQARDDRVAVNVAEAARRMSVSQPTMYEWVRAGHVPSVRVGRRILIPMRSLQDAISTGCRPNCTCVCHEGAA